MSMEKLTKIYANVLKNRIIFSKLALYGARREKSLATELEPKPHQFNMKCKVVNGANNLGVKQNTITHQCSFLRKCNPELH